MSNRRAEKSFTSLQGCMVDTTGLLLAVFAAFFFGTYYVPLKRSRVDYYTYQFFVGIGAFVVGVIASLTLGIPFEINFVGFLPGIIWAAANLIAVNAIRRIGVSGVAIAQAVIILVTFLWGILLFQESFQSIILALLGISLLLLGIPLIASRDNGNSVKKGLALFVIAGVLWGSVYVVPLYYEMSAKMVIPPMMSAILVSGILSFFMGSRKLESSSASNSIFSGITWAVGNVSAALSIDLIGLALAGPIPQLAMLVSVAWGVFYFKEVRERRNIVRVVVGGIVLVLGAVLLALAK